jgi:Domain of unknown function (DUF1996)
VKRFLTAVIAAAIVLGVMSTVQAVEKRFSVRCLFSHMKQDDPIVAPRAPAAPLHEFFANRSTNLTSTYSTMVDQPTTCLLPQDTAAYWAPTLTKGGVRIEPIRVLAYYRSVGALGGLNTRPYPRDFRMVSYDAKWLCRDNERYPIGSPPDCSAGEKVGLRVKFPECWNGTAIDSVDHLSHVAQASRKGCPTTHPIPLPTLALNFRWDLNDARGVVFHTGVAAHADFWNTWHQTALATLVDRCLGGGVSTLCGLQSERNNDL